LISQIRRSSISICANIAEGSGRNTEKEFLNFLKISRGSSFETETLMILSFDLKYLSEENFAELIEMIKEVQMMLHGLIKSIESNKIRLDT
jgi:four helix bundle protein